MVITQPRAFDASAILRARVAANSRRELISRVHAHSEECDCAEVALGEVMHDFTETENSKNGRGRRAWHGALVTELILNNYMCLEVNCDHWWTNCEFWRNKVTFDDYVLSLCTSVYGCSDASHTGVCTDWCTREAKMFPPPH